MFFKSISYFVAGIFLLNLWCPSSASPVDNKTRIVGGKPTTIPNVPYLVQVWSDDTFICGGALVSPLFVVSAAHCVIGVKANQLTIVGGASRLSDTGVRRKLSKVMRPASFSVNNLNKDVVVFKLESPMVGNNIKPIALNTTPLKRGMSLKVSGWGVTSENANNPSQQVRTVTVPVIPKAICTRQYRSILRLSKTMICASQPGVKDACAGDSGGPAVCNGKLCGIVSWGNGCARTNFPGIYTSIRTVLPVIRNAMKT